jgi:ankyrin repeat protein
MKIATTRSWPKFIGFALLATTLLLAGRALWTLYLSVEIYQSIAAGDASGVENLLHRGANPNRIGAGGQAGGTPLTWAVEQSDIKVLKVLLKGGADVNRRIGNDYTSLMLATTPQVALLLLDAGSNPRLKNRDGQTALQIAQQKKLAGVISVLRRAEQKQTAIPLR